MPDPLASDLARLADHARGLARSGVRFPVLTCAIHARERGLDRDEAAAVVAQALEREVEEVRGVFDLALRAADQRRLRACQGVSCRSVGADALHREVLAPLELEAEFVLCLNNCDRGPSLEIDGRLYCGTDDRVALEERSWRD